MALPGAAAATSSSPFSRPSISRNMPGARWSCSARDRTESTATARPPEPLPTQRQSPAHRPSTSIRKLRSKSSTPALCSPRWETPSSPDQPATTCAICAFCSHPAPKNPELSDPPTRTHYRSFGKRNGSIHQALDWHGLDGLLDRMAARSLHVQAQRSAADLRLARSAVTTHVHWPDLHLRFLELFQEWLAHDASHSGDAVLGSTRSGSYHRGACCSVSGP